MKGTSRRFAGLLVSAVLAPQADKWEKDIAAFEAQDAQAPPPAGGTVFVGSSSIRLWKTKDAWSSAVDPKNGTVFDVLKKVEAGGIRWHVREGALYLIK